MPAFGKTSKQLSYSVLGSPNYLQVPDVGGNWQGQGSCEGQTYTVKLEIQQEGESITGVLTSSGNDGTIVHNIKGSCDKKQNKYICEDTSVSKVNGQLGLSPAKVSYYEISIVDDGQKLVGWAKINRNSKAWFDLSKSDDHMPVPSYPTETVPPTARESESTISEPIIPQVPTQSSASSPLPDNKDTLTGIWSGTCKGNDPAMSVTLEIKQDGDTVTGSWESKGKSGECKRYLRGSYDKSQDAFVCRDIGFDFDSPASGWHHSLIDKYEIHEVDNGQKLIGTYISTSAHDNAWFSLQRKAAISSTPSASTSKINHSEQNKTAPIRPLYSQSSAKINAAPQYTSTELSANELEQYIFRLINRDRIQLGRQPLSLDTHLSKVAQDYAEYMLANNHFGHVDLDGHNGQYRAQQAGITCSVDDNFALEPRTSKSDDLSILNKIEQSYMAQQTNQRKQRENVLAPDHRYVGIGIARSNDKLIMVQEYTRVNPSTSDNSANTSTYSPPSQNIQQNDVDIQSNTKSTPYTPYVSPNLDNPYASNVVASYMDYIHRTLKVHWHAPATTNFRVVTVYFIVHQDGSASDISVGPNETSDECTQAAIDAIKAAMPFEPLGPELISVLKSDSVNITFSFTYNRGKGYPYGASNLAAPSMLTPFTSSPYSQSPPSPVSFNYLKSPYTGSSGYFDSATAQGIHRWPREKLPLKVFIADGRGVPGYRDFFYGAMAAAFNQWTAALNNRITWQIVPIESDADIVCTWTNSRRDFQLHEFSEQGETYTNWVPDADKPNEFCITHGTIKICTMFMFGIRPMIGNEVSNVCLHEVGHVLGLYRHSPHYGDVMYHNTAPSNFLYGGAPLERLSRRDVDTINYLYAEY